MFSVEEFKKKKGKIVEYDVFNHILENFYLWKHSVTQLGKRSNLIVRGTNGKLNNKKTKENIVRDIKTNRILAYYNTDGSVNIAVSKFNYYVFIYQEDSDNEHIKGKWLLCTYKEPSWNGIDIFKKRKMAEEGYDRVCRK